MNPDLDGVACGIVWSTYLAADETVAGFAGVLNAETTYLLESLGLDAPSLIDGGDVEEWDDIVLVDCHHPAQLPHLCDLGRVSVIVDHHPDGDPSAFPRATVQNERVGAAATLISERVAELAGGLEQLSTAMSALLACAIASNTLDFSAPSTTDRDRAQFRTLTALAAPYLTVGDLLSDMRVWRQEFLRLSTDDAIGQDVKVIESMFGPVAIAQLEADGARQLLKRLDIGAAVDNLVERPGVVGAILSLVDTAEGTTTLVCTDDRLRQALMKLSPVLIDYRTLELPLIALRKTHIIPALTSERGIRSWSESLPRDTFQRDDSDPDDELAGGRGSTVR